MVDELDWLDRFSGLIAVMAILSVLIAAVAVRARPPEAPVARFDDAVEGKPLPGVENGSGAIVAQNSAPGAVDRAHDLRVAKATWIVARLYPDSGFGPYVPVLIAEHERLERDGGSAMDGYGGAWWWSLVYGGANFNLRVGATAPGNCAGPLDVKAWPLVLDPVANIRHHCAEMAGFYRRGVRGIALCEHVFFPARPHDWGGGRFRRADRLHRAAIRQFWSNSRND